MAAPASQLSLLSDSTQRPTLAILTLEGPTQGCLASGYVVHVTDGPGCPGVTQILKPGNGGLGSLLTGRAAEAAEQKTLSHCVTHSGDKNKGCPVPYSSFTGLDNENKLVRTNTLSPQDTLALGL